MEGVAQELLLAAMLEAGKAILQIYSEQNIEIQYKEDRSPLTRADLLASEILIRALSQTGIPVICEETELPSYQERVHWPAFWLVDPLDGTKEFLQRNGEFTVNVGLIQNNSPVEGYILVPAQQVMYWGRVGEGAFFAPVDNFETTTASALRCKATALHTNALPDLVRVVTSRSHLDAKTLEFIRTLSTQQKKVEQVAVGSSVKFCYLAHGRAEVYVRYSPTMEWDTAAGHAIALAAGANVTGLTYNKETLKNEGFMVCHPLLNLPFT